MEYVIDALLQRLLATTMQSAVLATAVWLVCRANPRLSPSRQCTLWWLVALQALVGLIAKPLELPWLPQVPEVIREAMPIIHANAGPQTTRVTNPVSPADWLTWQSALFMIWAAGALIMMWSTLREWHDARGLLKGSSPCNDQQMLETLERASISSGVRAAPGLRLSGHIDTPVLIGTIRPVLLLPANTTFTAAELDMVVAHELAHLRRRDLWWGVIPVLFRNVFFFHPFAHLTLNEYGIAREAACDAAVIAGRSPRDYGRLLVRLGVSPGARGGLAIESPTFLSLRRRLDMLQNTSDLSRAVSIAIMVVVALGVLPLRLVAATSSGAKPADVAGAGGIGSTNLEMSISAEPTAFATLPLETEAEIAMQRVQFEDPAVTRVSAGSPRNEPIRQNAAQQQLTLSHEQSGTDALSRMLIKRQAELAREQADLNRRQADIVRQQAAISSELDGLRGNEMPQTKEGRLSVAREVLARLRLSFLDSHPWVQQQLKLIHDLEAMQY